MKPPLKRGGISDAPGSVGIAAPAVLLGQKSAFHLNTENQTLE
ncbi:hypothetical protein [Caulobacter sp. RL271]|jgi:hypothetical protein|nr:hypothetical protein [Caulobacter segnis]